MGVSKYGLLSIFQKFSQRTLAESSAFLYISTGSGTKFIWYVIWGSFTWKSLLSAAEKCKTYSISKLWYFHAEIIPSACAPPILWLTMNILFFWSPSLLITLWVNKSVINNSSINLKININTAASSYFTINYTSSDENVAKIGLDGNISFFKTGEVIIHVTCYDGKSPKYLYSLSTGEKILNYVDYEIVFEIKPKLLITDLNSFFLKVRKSIGHFGAFLVLGIFSSLTYLLYFNSKKWKITLPINYLQGIGLAFFTEFIQLFVPGRVGSLTDVLIDSTGFIISSTIIIIIFIIITFKKKQK